MSKRSNKKSGGGCVAGILFVLVLIGMVAFAPYIIAIALVAFMLVGMVGVIAQAIGSAGR